MVPVVTLPTVTLTAAEVFTFPAASRATAVTECVPLDAVLVSHEVEYGAVISSAPTLAPSTLNCTPTTPTFADALAVTEVVPVRTAHRPGAVIETVGSVVSDGGALPRAVVMSV